MLEKIRGLIDNNIIVNINDVCLKILNDKELNSSFIPYKCNTIDSLLKKNPISPYIQKIKKSLINIINSQVYNDSIKLLFPNYNNYLLDDNIKTIEKFINQRLKF